jgi:hypothetical protein
MMTSMKATPPTRPARHSTKFRIGGHVGLSLLVFAALQAGCMDAGYRAIQIGQPQSEIKRFFPEPNSRETSFSLSSVQRDWFGRTDAFVVLLTRDRRVAAKFQATYGDRDLGFQNVRGYRLRGVVDPELAGFGDTGPIDTARTIADDLTRLEGDAILQEAHDLIAAGIVRLLQQWPGNIDPGPARTRLTDELDTVLGGGSADITVAPEGYFEYTYEQGSPP